MKKTYKKKKKKKKRVFITKVVFHKKNTMKLFGKATVDYKNVTLLKQCISLEGKILPRRATRLTMKQQRRLSTAIKTGRVAGLLPFINQ